MNAGGTLTGDMLMALLPMLIVAAIPLLLMAMVSIARSHRVAMLVTLAGFAAALLVIARSDASLAPMQVTPLFQVDAIGLYFVGLFVLGALATTLLSYFYLQGRSDQPEEYYMLLGTATLGAVAMALSAHFASFVLGLEVLSISLYGLISYPEEGDAPIEAAVKYLVLSGVASATLLFGMALVYAGCGSMSFADISARMALGGAVPGAEASAGLLTMGHAMILVAVAFKLSLVPFHMWTPDVYEGAPAPISGYLASVAKAAMMVLVLRYVAVTGVLEDPGLFNLVATLGVLSMVIGNLLALQQQNVKRLLAYSSIAHVGYLLIALPLVVVLVAGQNARVVAVEAVMIYLAVYVVTSIGAFAVVGLVSPMGTTSMRHELVHYRGLFWRQPVLASAFTVMLASLAGLPLTAGFIAKFYMISAGIQGQLWLLVWALILGSAIGAFYYLRVLMVLLAKHEPDAGARAGADTASDTRALPWVPLVTVAAIGVLLLALGVYPTPLIELAEHAMAVPLALRAGG